MKNIWQNEPAWLQQKRQLAATLLGRFPKVDDQDEWLSFWQGRSDGTSNNWLRKEEKDLIALPLSEAVIKYSDLLQENLMEKAIRWQDNQLNAAHLARVDCGQFIYVPTENYRKETVNFSPQASSTNIHNVIIIGSNVNITIEEKICDPVTKPVYAATELLIGANSNVSYRVADQLSGQCILQAVHAYQAHGSTLNLELASTTASKLKTDLYSFLDGNNTTWNATVGTQTTKNGQHDIISIVDGFGKGTAANLSVFTSGNNIKYLPLRTGSGEPLEIMTKQVNEQKLSSWLKEKLGL